MAEKETPKSNYNPELNNMLLEILRGDGTRNDIEKAFHLIMAGADPDLKQISYDNSTILKKVIYLQDLNIFKKFVIEAKCSTNIKSLGGRKPIDFAIKEWCGSIVQWLLENDAASSKETIMDSIIHEKRNRLHLLIDSRRLLDKEQDGIFIAALLIDNGVDLLERNEDGMIPWELAEKKWPNSAFSLFLKKETSRKFNKIDDNEKINLAKANLTELYLMEENRNLKKEITNIKEKLKILEDKLGIN